MRRIILFFVISLLSIRTFGQIYDPVEAANYAKDWCNDRNPKFNSWEGHDCANFVSQCLKAGGLDLSAGIGPPQNGVDNKGCIPSAQNLRYHLEHYQQTELKTEMAITTTLSNFDLGDPVFVVNQQTNRASHVYICSTVSGTEFLYSAHTNDRCDVPLNYADYRTFVHINSLPAHCDNCIQDADETGIDCGGSCPPCQHATENKVYNYSTESNRLPAETYAINNITAGGANVTVYPGENVSFVTAGSIDLTPGFWAKQGCNFKGDTKKKRLDATADCNAFCDPITHNFCTPGCADGLNDQLIWEISNATSAFVRIYQWSNLYGANMNYLVYHTFMFLERDGETMLWDLFSGTPQYYSTFLHPVYDWGGRFFFDAYVNITSCQGKVFSYVETFMVDMNPCHRSAQQEADNQYATEYLMSHNVTPYKDYELSNMENPTDNFDYFSLYPNPTSGTLIISSSEPLQAFSDLTLTNNSGQTVYGQKYLDDFTLSLPPLPNGEYFLSVRINQQPVARKVILQR